MKHTYEIVPATYELAAAVAADMRQADIDEVWAAGRQRPENAIRMSIEGSHDTAGIGLVDGEPVCAFGIGSWSVLRRLGVPWLLGTNKLARHAPHFIRESHNYVEAAKDEFQVLENYIDARNTEALKWLKWLDFKVDPAAPFGPDRLPFHRFHWEAEDVL